MITKRNHFVSKKKTETVNTAVINSKNNRSEFNLHLLQMCIFTLSLPSSVYLLTSMSSHFYLFSHVSRHTCLSLFSNVFLPHVSRLFFSLLLHIFLSLSSYDLSVSLSLHLSLMTTTMITRPLSSCAENTYQEGRSAWAFALHWLAN